ncbi:MAG: SagB family peptide dehydrogenase [Nitrospirales bacterium]|nr:SagB family peptide dehydrogenase [Nitrospirales bacterium]
MSLKNITTLLHCAYGVTRDNRGTKFPRAFRVTPSGGALYPLEIFFFSSKVKNLIPGLYHYNPSKHHLRFLRKGNFASVIAQRTPFPNLVKKASLLIFITALFERSIFKYGDRGYRFVFLEAGHVAQNLNLVSNAMGLNSVNIGGFYDREMDDFLGLDGITHSTIYLTAIGKNAKEAARALPLRNKIRKDLLPLGVHERRRNEKKPKYK